MTEKKIRYTAGIAAILLALCLFVGALPAQAEAPAAPATETPDIADMPTGDLWGDIILDEIPPEELATPETAREYALSVQEDTVDASPVTGTGVYYTYLTDKQKAVYAALLSVITDVENCTAAPLDEGLKLERDDMLQALNAVQYDHPEVFWTGGSIGAAQNAASKYYIAVGLSKDKLLTRDAAELESMRSALEARVKAIAGAVTDTSNVGKIALALHDATAAAISYDYSAGNEYMPHTMYNALVTGKAVCDGYAKTYEYLLGKFGITATMVTNPATGFKHGWSLVKLGDSWYETDVTWDDTDDKLSHELFDLPTVTMETKHGNRGRGTSGTVTKLPIATGTLYTYDYIINLPAPTATPMPNYGTGITGFVTRLYRVCLGRAPEASGLKYWVQRLESRTDTGTQVAAGFVFSDEFKGKNYCNSDFVKQLYRAYMGREYDAEGLAYWLTKLENGAKREEVFNGFAASDEFAGICGMYGIAIGSPIEVPEYGTIPTGVCLACGEVDGVTAFVTRLYRICLDREPESAGLAYWTNLLWSHSSSSRDVARGFIFSAEFTGHRYSNTEFLDRLYHAFMDRAPDAEGNRYWLARMAAGTSREEVLNGFVNSDEYTAISRRYGIVRG